MSSTIPQTRGCKEQENDSVLLELEKKFDSIHEQRCFYFSHNAVYDYARLGSLNTNDINIKHLVRVYKKFTWLMTHPKNYEDGLWETF